MLGSAVVRAFSLRQLFRQNHVVRLVHTKGSLLYHKTVMEQSEVQEAFSKLWSFCAAMGHTQNHSLNTLLRAVGDAVAPKLHLLVTAGCGEPELHGPYEDEEARVEAFKLLRRDYGDLAGSGLYLVELRGDVTVTDVSGEYTEEVCEYERRDNADTPGSEL